MRRPNDGRAQLMGTNKLTSMPLPAHLGIHGAPACSSCSAGRDARTPRLIVVISAAQERNFSVSSIMRSSGGAPASGREIRTFRRRGRVF